MTQTSRFREGEVFTYTPEQHHCREGQAIADAAGRLIDTFWGTGSYDPFTTHALTDQELGTIVFAFNVADFRELARHEEHSFEDFAESDRAVLSSQHGLRRTLLVRNGAMRDQATIIARAEERLREAEEALRSARASVESRRAALERVRNGEPW